MKNCIKESSHFAAGKDHISSFIFIERGGRTYYIIDSLLVFLWNIKDTLIPYLKKKQLAYSGLGLRVYLSQTF